MKFTIGFIGCGNMGGALVKAVSKTIDGKQIALCDALPEKAEALAKACGATALPAKELVENTKIVVLGVKPQNAKQTLAPLKESLQKNQPLLISMMAGTPINAVREFAGVDLPVIRIMPNLPAMLGEGMILYATDGVDLRGENEFLRLFDKAGVLDKLPEELIDCATALSGSGPAYVYAFTEALIEQTVALGIPKEKAELYAYQTVIGAGKMMAEFGDPASLRKAVCSPGGTTLAGLDAMEKNGFSSAVKAGVENAYKRALELKK